MTSEELERLLSQGEGIKLEFKRQLYQLNHADAKVRERHWGEFIKDILSLANGNEGHADDPGYLIIGADDVPKPDGTRELFDTTDVVLPREGDLIQKMNSACNPPMAAINCQRISIDKKQLIVFTVPASSHLFATTRPLTTSRQAYPQHTVFVRRADGVGTASPNEINAIQREKELRLQTTRYRQGTQAAAYSNRSQLAVPNVFQQSPSSNIVVETIELGLTPKHWARAFIGQPKWSPSDFVERDHLFAFSDETKPQNVLELFLDRASRYSPDLVLLPELSVPESSIDRLSKWTRQNDSMVIGGSHYVWSKEGAIATCPVIWKGSVYLIDKIHPAPVERSPITGLGLRAGTRLKIFSKSPAGTIGILICSDFLAEDVRQLILIYDIDILCIPAFQTDSNIYHQRIDTAVVDRKGRGIYALYSNNVCAGYGDGKSSVFGLTDSIYLSKLTGSGYTDAKFKSKLYELADDEGFLVVDLDLESKRPSLPRTVHVGPNAKLVAKSPSGLASGDANTYTETVRRTLARLASQSEINYGDAAVIDSEEVPGKAGPQILSDLYVEREEESKIISSVLADVSPTGVILVYGEAGTGKTSLLWSIFGRLKEHRHLVQPWFLKASSVLDIKPQELVETIAFVVQTENRKPILLLDTADLVVHAIEKRDLFLEIIEAATVNGCWIIVTSRPREARSYLWTVRSERFVLGDYREGREFDLAVEKHVEYYYINARLRNKDEYRMILGEAVIKGRPIREVCLKPLTLRMLFAIYGPEGEIPPTEINGVQLYDRYWEVRVKEDRRGGDAHIAKESANLASVAGLVALQMLREGRTEIHRDHALSILNGDPTLAFPPASAAELDALVSRGVLLDRRSFLEFFHQTFFEHAAARGLIEMKGSKGLSALAERCQDHPEDSFRAPVLEQALILSTRYGKFKALTNAIVLNLLSSVDSGNLLIGAYVYCQLEPIPDEVRSAVQNKMRSHVDVRKRFIASLSSIAADRFPEVFRELDFVWETIIAPNLEARGQWAGCQTLLDQLPRIAIQGGANAEWVSTFLNKHDIYNEVLKHGDTIRRLTPVLAALAPYYPESVWKNLVFLYKGRTDRPNDARVMVRIVNALTEQAKVFSARTLATDFEAEVEPNGPAKTEAAIVTSAWGNLWAAEWSKCDTEVSLILATITSESNRTRFGRQLVGLCKLFRSRLDGDLTEVFARFLTEKDTARRAKWIDNFWQGLIRPSTVDDVCDALKNYEEYLVNHVVALLMDEDLANRRIAAQFGRLPDLSDKVTRRLLTKVPRKLSARWLNPNDLGLLLPLAYLQGHDGAREFVDELVTTLENDKDATKDTLKYIDQLISGLSRYASLGRLEALDILFRFARVNIAAREKVVTILEAYDQFPTSDGYLERKIGEYIHFLNDVYSNLLLSADPGDRRRAARLLFQMARIGMNPAIDENIVRRRFHETTDDIARAYLAMFMGHRADDIKSAETAIDLLIECAESDEAAQNVEVVATLVQCARQNGLLPIHAKRILSAILAKHRSEFRLLQAARMVQVLAETQAHFPQATEVLNEVLTGRSVKEARENVTESLRYMASYPIKVWIQHSTRSDIEVMLKKVREMEKNMACLFIRAAAEIRYDDVRSQMDAIFEDISTAPAARDEIRKLRKLHEQQARPEVWLELD